MSKRQAEQFEGALQRASHGEQIDSRQASLVRTAQQATALAELPPAPPRGLTPGRQRFLAEAGRRRAEMAGRRPQRLPMTSLAKLATVLAAALLFFGLVFGTSQAMADSLPDTPLYGLKLAGERIRLTLTSDLQARANLHLAMAEERLDEIAALLRRGQPLDAPVANQAQEQLTAALGAAAQLGDPAAAQQLQRLANAIQQRQQTMQAWGDTSSELPLRQLLREMERVREEAQAGQGDPAGLRQRLRQGVPPEQTDLPEPSHTPQSTHTPGPGQTPDHTPGPNATPTPSCTPQHTAQPSMTPRQTGMPQHTSTPGATQGPTGTPQQGPGPQATPGPTTTPGQGPGPQATPNPTGTPGQGPGPQVTPNPTGTPGQGPGPQVTPDPTGTPGQGPGPQVTPDPTGTPGQGPGLQATPDPTGTPGQGSESTNTPGPEYTPSPERDGGNKP